MGSDHAHNLARGVRGARLAAIADADVPRAEALAASLGGPRVFGDGEEMISSGAVDAVIIAAPDPFHAPLALACLEAGLPVLCEKPLVPTAAEAVEVVRAHDALPAPLMTVGFMRRFDPGYLALRDAAGVLHTVELQVHAQYGYDVRCELVCERASVELPPVPALVEADEVIVSTELARRSAYPADWRPRFAAAYRAELAAWVEASLEHRPPEGGATARDALRATVLAESVVRSMEQDGARVAVPAVDDVLAGRA